MTFCRISSPSPLGSVRFSKIESFLWIFSWFLFFISMLGGHTYLILGTFVKLSVCQWSTFSKHPLYLCFLHQKIWEIWKVAIFCSLWLIFRHITPNQKTFSVKLYHFQTAKGTVFQFGPFHFCRTSRPWATKKFRNLEIHNWVIFMDFFVVFIFYFHVRVTYVPDTWHFC
jgi:hypothetical protein